MKSVKQWVAGILMLLLVPAFADAQKIAVVLSGGGAKGVCHIGLLKALEENGIPIDYIAGTSMGAIIGGLYASGYTPEQMESLMLSPEFMRWATGEIDPSYAYYYRKDVQNAAWVSVKINYKEQKIKPKLPTNIVSPYEMDFQFMQIFAEAGAAADYDFNRLFVPFRCVASDVAANAPYILKKGSLENAIRASMTFPFYFKPIQIEGRLLFDGGMYNNFPVDIAIRDFKPDYIIGCKAAAGDTQLDPDNILSQLENMLMTKTVYEIPEGQKGIMIKPSLFPVEVNDFSRTREMIDSGYTATLALIDSIRMEVNRKISTDERNNARDRFNNRKPELYIDSLYVEGVNSYQADYVRRLMQHMARKRMLPEIKADYFRLLADDRVSSIFPRLKFNPSTGYYDLHLEVELSNQFELSFGGLITSSPNTEGFLQLNYNMLRTNSTTLSVNTYFGRFYTSGKFRVRTDYPIENPYFVEGEVVLNRYNYFPSNFYFLDDILSSNLSRYDNAICGGIGWPVSNTGVARISGMLGDWGARYYHTNAIKKDDEQDLTTFRSLSALFSIDINSFNFKQFPTAGSRFQGRLRICNGNETHNPGTTSVATESSEQKHTFLELKLTYDSYFSRIGKVKIGGLAELLFSNRPLLSNFTAAMIFEPQFNPIPDAQTIFSETLRAPAYLAGGVKTLLPLTGRIDYRLEGYYFQSFRGLRQMDEQKAAYQPWFSHHAFVLSTSLVAQSFLGPISLNLNYIEKENFPWSFTLNFGYLLFNKGAHD